MDSLVDWTWLRKESLSLRICQRIPKLKSKDNKRKSWNRISKKCGTTTQDVTYMKWEYQEKKDQRREKIFETNMFLSQLLTLGLKS